MWSTLVTCYSYRTFKLSLLDSPPTYNSAIIRKMFQTLLSITKSFFVDQLWLFLMLYKMVLRIMYIYLGPGTSFLKTIGKEFWMFLKNISHFSFLFNHMNHVPWWSWMEAYERGGFSAYDDQKIQSYLTSLSNIRYRYIIYVYLLSLRPSLTCIFHKTSICSAYVRLIFEVYRCKLLSC